MKTKQVNTRKTTEDASLTASNALVRLAVSACAAGLVATCAFSKPPVGPGSYKVKTAEDVSYVESGFAVPANATQTIRPGVFFPEGGPVGVDEVVWRNVKLTDIASFTGKISEKDGNNYFWKEAGCYHVTTNAGEGYVQCQLQMKGVMSPTYGFVMQYRQEGQDVKARIAKGKYQTNTDVGVVDFDKDGGNLDVTNTLYAADYKVRALADLGFVLRDGAETSVAPTEIVLASTDTSALDVSDEEVHRHVPCIASTNEILTVARNLRVADIVGMTGDISLKVEHNTLTTEVAWTNAQSYALVVTNGGSTVKMYLLAEVDESTSRRRAGAVVQFDQVNADVQRPA